MVFDNYTSPPPPKREEEQKSVCSVAGSFLGIMSSHEKGIFRKFEKGENELRAEMNELRRQSSKRRQKTDNEMLEMKNDLKSEFKDWSGSRTHLSLSSALPETQTDIRQR